MNLLAENEIEVIDVDEASEGRRRRRRRRAKKKPLSAPAAAAAEEAAEEAPPLAAAEYARGADPVKLYLKKMGSVSLLTREGEVEIAKRIEEGEVEILRALLASKLGTLAIVDLGERLETGRTKVKDVIRGVDEEVSADDEKKYLDRVLAAIAKVKSLVELPGKNGREARRRPKARSSPRRRKKRSRRKSRSASAQSRAPSTTSPSTARRSTCFRPRSRATGSAVKSMLDRAQERSTTSSASRKPKQMREIAREFKKGPETHPALCKEYDVSEQKLAQLVQSRRGDLQEDPHASKKKPASRSTSFAAFTTR